MKKVFSRATRFVTPASLRRFGRLLVLVAAAGLAGACYEIEHEVILASDAVSVYGLPGTYTSRGESTETTEISAVPNSNDYRFVETGTDSTSSGYLRAIPLRGDIYAVQIKFDDEAVYYIMFYEFTFDSSGANFVSLWVDDPVEDLALQHGVTLEFYDVDYLTGSRQDILNFIRAHADLSFSEDSYW